MDFDALRQVVGAFERFGVRYVIFGAVALNFHGLARFTEDRDVFIAPEAGNIERLRAALRSVFDDPEIDRITTEDLLGDYPAVQYIPPGGGFHIDLLTRLGEAFTFEDLENRALAVRRSDDFSGQPENAVSARMRSCSRNGSTSRRTECR